MAETEKPDIEYWSEGVVVEGNRMTVDEAESFIREINQALSHIKLQE